MRHLTGFALLAVIPPLACQPRLAPVAATPSAAEAEIRAMSHALVEAEQRRDIDAVLPFFAEDAVFQLEGAPPIRGRPGIQGVYEEFFRLPVASFGSTIERVVVAGSGDLAYETGLNEFVIEQDGRRITTRGKYLGVWRRDADGRWRIAAVAITNDGTP